MSKTSTVRTVGKRKSRALTFENLDKRELMAADPSRSFEFIGQTPEIKAAEAAVIRTGQPTTIRLSGAVPSTKFQDHAFVEKANLAGNYNGVINVRLDNNKLIHEFVDLKTNFSGRSGLSDIDLTAIATDITASGRSEFGIVNGQRGQLIDSDWQSKATTNVSILSGPAASTDYIMTSIAADGLDSPDVVSGLSTEEVVGNAVRNSVPLQVSIASAGGELIEQLKKIKIPNVDVAKVISGFKIGKEIFAPVGSKSNAQIYSDVLKNKSMLVGINSDADLMRLAQGSVTTIVGASFKVEKEWNRVLTKISIVKNAPLFGGLITASLGAEANVGISVAIAGVFAADSRGFGLTEGSAISIKPKLEVMAKGNIAFLGTSSWSVIGLDVRAGVYMEGRLWLEVGKLGTDAKNLVDGRILYVTANRVQTGSFAGYLSARVTAEVGARLESKAKVLGITVWKMTNEKSFDVYKKTIFEAKRSLSE
jgi:hypothetical protein